MYGYRLPRTKHHHYIASLSLRLKTSLGRARVLLCFTDLPPRHSRSLTMDEFTADAFANRDEPIPVVTLSASDDHASDVDEHSSRRHRIKKVLSSSKLRDKLYDMGENNLGPSLSLQDRLFARCVLRAVQLSFQEGYLQLVGGCYNKSYPLRTCPMS